MHVAKIDLPKDATDSMDMTGLIIYKSRVYKQTGTKINPESAEDFIIKKLVAQKEILTSGVIKVIMHFNLHQL